VNSLIEYLSRLIANLKEETGQTMAEYAVVLGVITIAVVVTLGFLSTKITSVLNNVITSM
jgi:Flp pilus assembly pilin Flp